MSEFIRTASVIGDDAMCDGIIQGTLTEIKDDLFTGVLGLYFLAKCSSLVNAELPNATDLNQESFFECANLVTVSLPEVQKLGVNTFPRSGIKMLDLPKCTHLGTSSLYQTRSLTALILRSTAGVCTNEYWTNLSGHAANRYIYVPRTLDDGSDGVEAYKAATNWSAHAEWIRAIEDYTVDGTLTGELDETKI